MRPHLALFLFLLFYLTPFFLPLSPAFAEQKESHFADVWRTTTPLPIGVNVASVEKFLEKKVMLRSDVGGVPLKSLENSEELFLARSLPTGAFFVHGAVVKGLPITLRDRVPPTRKLLTLFVSQDTFEELLLCRPYEQMSLSILQGKDTVLEIEKNVLLVSSESTPQGETKIESEGIPVRRNAILVVAVRDTDVEAVVTAYQKKSSRVKLDCSIHTEYE